MPGEWWDKSWGVTEGCTPVSRGCDNCWAAAMFKRFGQDPHEVRIFPERLEQPLHWRKPHRVFVAPRGDLFHDDVPEDFIDQVFAVMALAPEHTFLVLTKRPDRPKRYLHPRQEQAVLGGGTVPIEESFWPEGPSAGRIINVMERLDRERGAVPQYPRADPWPLPNVYLGVSVEDQETADERIPILLDTPAAKRFVSAEPLLGRVNVEPWIPVNEHSTYRAARGALKWAGLPNIDWLVTAPESGPSHRYCDLDWVRSVRDQCAVAKVPFMLKHLYQDGKKVSLPRLDGRRHAEGP